MAQRLDVQYVRFYTDGSAARKVAPLVPLQTAKLPEIKKTKKIVLRIDPVALAGILTAAVMLVLMVVGMTQLKYEQQQLQEMRTYVDDLRSENQLLENTFQQNCDLEQIERTAVAFGFVPKEQVKHIYVHVEEPDVQETPGSWERIYTFLTGLFA